MNKEEATRWWEAVPPSVRREAIAEIGGELELAEFHYRDLPEDLQDQVVEYLAEVETDDEFELEPEADALEPVDHSDADQVLDELEREREEP